MKALLLSLVLLCACVPLQGCAHLQRIEEKVETMCDHVAKIDELLAPMLLQAASDPNLPTEMRQGFMDSATALVAIHDMCFDDPDA